MPVPSNWHWLLTDPIDSTTYLFPKNPNAMTSPYPVQGTIQTLTSVADPRPRAQTVRSLTEWTFGGKYVSLAQREGLLAWVSKSYPIDLRDHLGRTWSVLFKQFDDTVIRPTQRVDIQGTYTITCWTLGGPT